jgi:dephospho-CoA kinase
MAEGDGEGKNGGDFEIKSPSQSRYRRRAELAGGESIARPKVIGLTGGIASGKTTVANFFRKWGATIISGDELGWKVLQNKTVQRKLVGLFGFEIFSKGKINRSVLGPKVFADRKTLLRFNRVVHPPLISLLKKEVARTRKKKVPAIVIDAALLAEWKIPVKLDLLLMVHAPRKIQLRRLMAKGLSRPQALRRISSQLSYKKRRRVSDAVLLNDGNLSRLEKRARHVWIKIVAP